MFEITLVFIFALLFGWLSRMAGGGWPSLPFGLDGILYAIPYGAISAFMFLTSSTADTNSYFLVVLFSLVAFGVALYGKRMGHGRFIDLGTWTKDTEREKVEYYAMRPIWFLEERNKVLYDLIGLTITGIIVALGAAVIAFNEGFIFVGICLLIGGGLKGIAYYIGYSIDSGNQKDWATRIGEFLTGFFGGFSLGIVFLEVM